MTCENTLGYAETRGTFQFSSLFLCLHFGSSFPSFAPVKMRCKLLQIKKDGTFMLGGEPKFMKTSVKSVFIRTIIPENFLGLRKFFVQTQQSVPTQTSAYFASSAVNVLRLSCHPCVSLRSSRLCGKVWLLGFSALLVPLRFLRLLL